MKSTRKFKIVFLGDPDVGKTSVFLRFISDKYSDFTLPTVGVDFDTKTLQVKNQTLTLQLWDTAGQEKYKSMIASSMKNADACVIIMDTIFKTSFDSIPTWIDFVKETRGDDVLLFLVANKIDLLDAKVSMDEVEQYSKTNNLNFSKVSAKTGEGIQTFFMMIATKLYEKNTQTQNLVTVPPSIKKNSHQQLSRAGIKISIDDRHKNRDGRCSC